MPNRDDLRVLRQEIDNDLAAVAQLLHDLTEARRNLPPDPTQENLSHVGYLLHTIYTAWESAFHRIATTFENRLDASRWHEQLLKRMTLEIPGLRPAVIDAATADELAILRGFRHFFRHNYAARFKWRRMQHVLESLDNCAPLVTGSLRRFLNVVEQISDQSVALE